MNSAVRSKVPGRAMPLRGNDIDTDRIIPARFLKSIVFDGLGSHVFEDDRAQLRADDKVHPFEDERYQGASILVVGRNFGCGSSREHAPQALHRFGLNAVVGVSFAEIFFGNCCAIGVPCVTLAEPDLGTLLSDVESDPSREFELDLERMVLVGKDRSLKVKMPEGPRQQLVTGRWDTTTELLEDVPAIRKVAEGLPYLNDWSR